MMHRTAILMFFPLLLAALVVSSNKLLVPFTDEMIDYINKETGALWKAGLSRKFTSLETARRFLGALREGSINRSQRRPTLSHENDKVDLPDSFDAREKWPNCTSIGLIRDQSSCGSCWAFAAVEAMSDRLCIHSDGKINVDLSARNLLSCCKKCGFGCHGGFPGQAWDYWMSEGIVTGGSKEQGTGCQPYPFPSCSHLGSGSREPCPEKLFDTPECLKTCNEGYGKSYEKDKYFAASSYNLHSLENDIKTEIFLRGPVEAVFTVYEDFLHYQSGIYHHVAGEFAGGHAVRIVGWGTENDVPYWLIANSWNDQWGENGYFRIRRGNDECGIESEVVTGLPTRA